MPSKLSLSLFLEYGLVDFWLQTTPSPHCSNISTVLRTVYHIVNGCKLETQIFTWITVGGLHKSFIHILQNEKRICDNAF